jgi:hypothetical protein
MGERLPGGNLNYLAGRRYRGVVERLVVAGLRAAGGGSGHSGSAAVGRDMVELPPRNYLITGAVA